MSKVLYNWFLQKCYNSFVEICCFELRTVLRQCLGTVVKNAKHIKVALGIYLHYHNQFKNLSVPILVTKICFPKIFIFWTHVKTWTSNWALYEHTVKLVQQIKCWCKFVNLVLWPFLSSYLFLMSAHIAIKKYTLNRT